MKTRMIYVITATLAVFVFIACQDNLIQNGPDTTSTVKAFMATTDSPSTKTTLNQNGSNYEVLWQNGDEITVIDAAATPNVGVYSTTSTTKQGTFSFKTGKEAAEPNYKAYYPATLYNGGTPAIPATQQYAADNIAGSPMYAESSTNNLAFKNICGIIRLNIGTTMLSQSVASVSISANEGMSGDISNMATLVSDGYEAAVSGTAGVTLDCGAGVDISSTPTAFHFAVPANTYNGLQITVTTKDGLTQTRTAKSSIVVGRSSITDISLSFNDLVLAVDLSSTTGTVTIPSGVNARLTGSKSDRTVIAEGGGSVITLEDASFVRLEIQGDATIVSKGTNTIADYPYDVNPVEIKEGYTATFRGDGILNLNASYCAGAIACENNNANIIIENGTYYLVNGSGAGHAISAGGLTITGGTVNTTGDIYAEKDVTISGGAVTATGDAQGIYVYGGDLLITGGTVTAEQTAGLSWGSGPQALCAGIVVNTKDGAGVTGGNLTISGGTVNAIGHIGPGIGSAWRRSGWSYPSWTKSIVISGGTVTVSTEESGFGAIHYNGFGNATACDAITITSGITSLTLIQGATAAKMFSTGDVSATFTVDGKDMTGYFADPASVDWTFDHIQRTVTTTTNENDTWTFTPKP